MLGGGQEAVPRTTQRLWTLVGSLVSSQEQWVTMGMFEAEGSHEHTIFLEGNSQYRIIKVRKVK